MPRTVLTVKFSRPFKVKKICIFTIILYTYYIIFDSPKVYGQQNVPKQRLDDDTRLDRAHNGPSEPYEPGDMPPGPVRTVSRESSRVNLPSPLKRYDGRTRLAYRQKLRKQYTRRLNAHHKKFPIIPRETSLKVPKVNTEN